MPPLSRSARVTIVVCAFLGWAAAGSIMALMPLAGRSIAESFVGKQSGLINTWFGRYICAFLLGAACGGILFGWIGDRIGRAKAMGWSILCFSLFTGVTYFATDPWQVLVLRFVACLGVGGMWPNGVALASEAWSNVSRPFLAGLIGTSANLGFVLMSVVSGTVGLTVDNWRWIMLVGAVPALLGVFSLCCVAESPMWKASQQGKAASDKEGRKATLGEVFRPPLLQYTIIGILLGAVPLLGNWGGANWLVPWANEVQDKSSIQELKSWTQGMKSAGGAIGAFLGGWIASMVGRRTTYFVMSLLALLASGYIYWFLTPLSPSFLPWVFVIGFFGTIFFGWLPLYLPELFPTRVRATGTGAAFNLGRVITAFGVLGKASLLSHFGGDYGQAGRVTSLVFIIGMIVILFAPDTSKMKIDR